MSREIKLLNVGSTYDFSDLVKNLSSQNIQVIESVMEVSTDLKKLQEEIKKNQVSILNDMSCLKAHNIINHRSVGSHFSDYIDYVENKKGQLWGDSLFSLVFRETMQNVMKKNFYKGSVIFLGENIKILPVIEELSRFGFKDFDFLNLSTQRDLFDHIKKKNLNIFNIKVSSVQSTAFVRSQKEYALCFVLNDKYTQQTLDDMSYFHFLSAHSIVFDLSGKSNFLFKEVKALGIELFENKDIETLHKLKIIEKLTDYSKVI